MNWDITTWCPTVGIMNLEAMLKLGHYLEKDDESMFIVKELVGSREHQHSDADKMDFMR